MIKHTPGPWTVEHHGGPWHIFGANDERVGTYSTSAPASTAEQWDVSQANARLIAAAPELLAALESIVEDIHPNVGGTQGVIRKVAAAAIAKATGQP